jgi:Ca-activated chloride channel homolog
VSFNSPLLLLLLLLIPAGFLGWRWWRSRVPPPSVPFPDLDIIAAAAPPPRRRRHLPAVLAALALAGIGVALARPEVSHSVPNQRATIMLAIDVSRSMSAEDVKPYRLRAAQDAAIRFADKVPRHFEVGLVSFSGGATVLLPPSLDRDALKAQIESLVPEGATAIGDAVLASLEALKAAQPGVTKLESARILLLSDGANTNGVPLEEAATAAREAAVPVYTVALGTPDGVLFPDNKPVPPDTEALAGLAEATGGRSYESRDADSVSAVYNKLGTFIGSRTVEDEVTAWPAGIAALLLIGAGIAAWRLGPRLP